MRIQLPSRRTPAVFDRQDQSLPERAYVHILTAEGARTKVIGLLDLAYRHAQMIHQGLTPCRCVPDLDQGDGAVPVTRLVACVLTRRPVRGQFVACAGVLPGEVFTFGFDLHGCCHLLFPATG